MIAKYLLFGLVTFALGLGAGVYLFRSAQDTISTQEAKQKLQALAETDLEDYYRLKTMEEKYLKADEILGKIMVIFLADMGLRVSQSAQTAAKQPALVAPSASPPPPSPTPRAPSPHIPLATPVVAEDASGAFPKGLAQSEASLVNIREGRGVAELLKKTQLENFDAALTKTSSFTNNEMLQSLNGAFDGRASVTSGGKPRRWDVRIELAGTMNAQKLTGNLKIRMAENGRVFSDSSSNGNIPDFREFPANDSKAILAKAAPDTYFQVYYLKELDQLAANIYERKDDDSKFTHIGTMTLSRAH
jgi:hypothetical protein